MKTRYGFSSCLLASFWLYTSLLAVNVCRAAEWWLAPALQLGADYNDNNSLTTFPHSSTHGSRISPSLNFGVQSYIWQVNGSAKFTRQNYSNAGSQGRDSRSYTLSSQYATQRTTWRLDGNQSYSSMVINQAGDPDVGLLQLEKQRKNSGYAPSWSWAVDERTRLQLGYQKNTTSYEDGPRYSLFDYDSSTVTAGISRQLSIQTQAFFNLSYSIFDVPANNFESRTTGVQGGLTHSFSETLRTSLSIGAQRTVSEGIVKNCLLEANFGFGPICLLFGDVQISEDKISSLLSARLEKQFQVTRLSAGLIRSLNPSGSGTLVQTDALDLQVSRSFTPFVTGNLSLNFYDIRSSFGNITDTDRRLYEISPSLSWRWTEEWTVGAFFRYSNLKRDDDPRDAIARAIGLTLSYNGPKISVSR